MSLVCQNIDIMTRSSCLKAKSTLLQKFKVNTKLLLWSSVCHPIDMFLNAFLRSQSVISLKCSDMWYGWYSRDRAGES
jgi:hypothetical protein